MDAQQVRDLFHDPAIAIPMLCLILAVAAMVSGSLRAAANGVFHWPAFSAWSKDISTVLQILLLLGLSKLISFFQIQATVGGVDVGGLINQAAPSVFFIAGTGLAATFIAAKVAAIKDSTSPPDPVALAAKFADAKAIGDPIPKP